MTMQQIKEHKTARLEQERAERTRIEAEKQAREARKQAAALEKACAAELRLTQWRVAFGNESWAAIVRAAARGEPRYESFSMEAETLAPLLLSPRAATAGLDSTPPC